MTRFMRQEWGGRGYQVERTEGGRAAGYVPGEYSVNELTKMKRQTKHIRIGAENHKRLKQASVDTGKPISIIADEIFTDHFQSKGVPPPVIETKGHDSSPSSQTGI
jgi:hypothetical protein